MPESATSSPEVNIVQNCRSRVVSYRERMLRLSLFATPMLTFALIPVAAYGQGVLGPSPLNSTSQPGAGTSSPLATPGSTNSQNPQDDRGSSGGSSSPQVHQPSRLIKSSRSADEYPDLVWQVNPR